MKWMVKLYPKKWRDHYEGEFLFVFEQMQQNSFAQFFDRAKHLIYTWVQVLIAFFNEHLPFRWICLLFILPVVLLAFNQDMYIDFVEASILCGALLLFYCYVARVTRRLITKFILVFFVGAIYLFSLIQIDLVLDYFIYGKNVDELLVDGRGLTLFEIISEYQDDTLILVVVGLGLAISCVGVEKLLRLLKQRVKV